VGDRGRIVATIYTNKSSLIVGRCGRNAHGTPWAVTMTGSFGGYCRNIL